MSRFKSSNPFEDDDEDDVNDFVLVGKSKPSATYSYNSSNSPHANSASSQPRSQTSYDPSSLYSSNSTSTGYGYRGEAESNPFEDRRHQLMTQIDESENRQLDSTQRALASIYESEAMGVATAEVSFR